MNAHLVVVRGRDEYDRTIARYVECAAGPDFSEEDIGDKPPEEKRDVVDIVA